MNRIFIFLLCMLSSLLQKLPAEDLKTEKVTFDLAKELVHPLLFEKNSKKNTVPVEIVIPTSLPTENAWELRIWECHYDLKKAIQLLEIGISHQINGFIVKSEVYFKADKKDKEKFSKLCREYKIKAYFTSPKFGLPLKSSQLKTLGDICKEPIASGLILKFNKVLLNEKQTKEFFDLIYNSIPNQKLQIFIESFSTHAYFLKALQSIKKENVMPIQNWVDNKWSLTDSFSNRIKNYEKPQLIRMDISLEQFGKNHSFALMQDYIGYRQTQCLELAPQAKGVVVSFGNNMTSFGTMNALNVFTISKLLLNKEEDIDIINYQWFSTFYGEKIGDTLLELTSNSINVIRKTIYIRENADSNFSNQMLPESPIKYLTYSQFNQWFKVNKKKSVTASLIYREKIWANELIDKLLKDYKLFSSKNKLKDRKITIIQINHLKRMVVLFKDWTKLLITAQFNKIEKQNKEFQTLEKSIKEYPLLKSTLDSFKEIYIDQNQEIIKSIPPSNLPSYLTKLLDQTKSKTK